LISWRDDSTKCHFCGQIREHANHTGSVVGNPTYQIHDFKESVNEVAKLHTRLRGLVIVKLKKDCLDLPEKRYEVIRCKPTNSILRAAQLITKTAKRSLDALMLLRELSDGFQYREVGTNEFVKCSTCKGKGDIPSYLEELTSDEIEKKVKYVYDSEGYKIGEEPIDLVDTDRLQCPMCRGTGQTERMERSIVEVECPKDQVLIDMLERHEEAGRLNIYAGFEGSIDRVTRICKNQKWAVIRADGRGWCGFDDNGNKLGYSGKELMQLYTSDSEQYPNIAFVGQPGAAGMGLTLTASPTTFFFSNDFNGESRMQAEDRGHRIGMDIVKGGLIVDCFHLPTDEKVFNNLKLKKDLQYLSMTGLQSCLV
jgi:SNF2 family DNA or RNA helicase